METTTVLSKYEIERGKPASKNHAIIQTNLIFLLATKYGDLYKILPALRTIYIFHHREDYSIFVKEDLLKDEALGIELELKEVFK